MRARNSLIALLASALFLTGCGVSRDFGDLEVRMAALDARPSGRVPDVPVYESQELFFYTASDRRSPFRDPRQREEALAPQIVDTGIAPDLEREREELEEFTLDQLRMVGHIQREQQPLQALIVDPTGQLHRVQVERYLGQNFGRVVNVSPQRVEMLEIVPNGLGGWLERPQSLSVAQ